MGNKISEINNEPINKKRGSFSGKIGFILAASGSAVGLGNLWRFPYLAAQYGGGIFVLCYVLLAALFGFTLLMLEIAIGRHTGKSVIGAFAKLNKKFKWFGYVCVIVPIIIIPYYCVIGGWVLKFLWAFITGDSALLGATSEGQTQEYFSSFIGNAWQPLIFFLIFAVITIVIICFGVQKGLEKMSKILMPILAILAVGLMIFVLCQGGALDGAVFFLKPDFSKFSFKTVLGALGQLFYSMSLAMCIMITYGSYMKKKDSIPNSSMSIAIFDSGFAIIAGLIIIPAIFAFSGTPTEVLGHRGESLMFEQLTLVFNQIPGGRIFGIIFFILVFFAAVTSSISLVEAVVAVLCEDGRMRRVIACTIVFGIVLVLGVLSSLGYGVLNFIKIGDKSILGMFDFFANNILMPIIAIITCVICGYFIDKTIIPKEIGLDKKPLANIYFNVVVKYVAPICILAILMSGLFMQI